MSQHTPSVQKPDWQALSALHALPFAKLATHAWFVHTAFVVHSDVVVHVVAQAAPAHAYGAQVCVTAAGHAAELPGQVALRVVIPETQLPARQTVEFDA